MEVVKEAGDIDLARPVQVKVASELVVHGISDLYSLTVIQFVLQVLDGEFGVRGLKFQGSYKLIQLLLCVELLGDAKLELLKEINDTCFDAFVVLEILRV